ncbi:hypothetical protein QBS70_16405 [Cronobacter sakazakii]|nr:hypothetical protein [Cronobacter sakazakii]
MKKRSAGEIIATLRHADIEEYKAVICSKAAYLTGREAEMFVQFYGPLVGEITHQQQIRLFEIAYQEKVIYAKGVYDRHARHLNIPNALPWSRIDTVIRDTFIDTIFQGNVTANEMVAIIAKGGSRNEIITYLRNDVSSRRDAQRTQIRIRNLQK